MMKGLKCEVSLNNIEYNLEKIKELNIGKKSIAVVKANAYGLGLEGIAEFLRDRVDYFAVAELDEAKRIPEEKEVLILSPLLNHTDFSEFKENIIFTIDNEDIIDKIPEEVGYKVHVYVDTGMNRMGIKPQDLDRVIEKIGAQRPEITIHGIYTHLHNTKDTKYTLKQIGIFKDACEKYIGKIPLIHALNSAGTLNEEVRKACDFTNAFRTGNLLYGYDGLTDGFKKTYSYFADIINTYTVHAGEHIGYGLSYKAKKDIKVGVLGIGNIEHLGFNRDVRHNIFYDILKVIYNHIKKRPVIFEETTGVGIIGRPNMNITLVDVSDIDVNNKLRIEVSAILADSSIPKIYKYE